MSALEAHFGALTLNRSTERRALNPAGAQPLDRDAVHDTTDAHEALLTEVESLGLLLTRSNFNKYAKRFACTTCWSQHHNHAELVAHLRANKAHRASPESVKDAKETVVACQRELKQPGLSLFRTRLVEANLLAALCFLAQLVRHTR